MPVGEEVSTLYLQLGIAGATLLILLVFVILLFGFVGKSKHTDNISLGNRLDRLCDKIDNIVTVISENTIQLNKVLITNDNDQKETIRTLKKILDVSIDSQRRLVRIDDRTYHCLGMNSNQKLSNVSSEKIIKEV